MIHVLLASPPPRKPAKYTGLREAGQYGLDGRTVEAVLAHDLALELQDGNPHVETRFPVLAAVDVADLDIEPAADERQQFLDEYVAEMAALPAVDIQKRLQGITAPRRVTVGVNRARQVSLPSRRRPPRAPASRPPIADAAAPASPSARA